MRARDRLAAALVLTGVLALGAIPSSGNTPVHIELAGGRWSPGGPATVRVRAAGVPIGTVLSAVARATGVAIDALPADLLKARITLDAGPLPLERIVRQMVRPHGLAAVYARGGRLTRLVVVPTDAALAAGAAAEPSGPRDEEGRQARVDGAWWRLEDVGPDASPQSREAALLALGGAFDDPAAVALLEAAADGRAGLAPDDPARRLARRILASRAGSDEEDAQDPQPGS